MYGGPHHHKSWTIPGFGKGQREPCDKEETLEVPFFFPFFFLKARL